NAVIVDLKNLYDLGDIASFLVLAGLIGVNSVLMLRRSYTSPLQFVAFFMAILCLDNGRVFGVTRCYHSRPKGASSLISSLQDGTIGNGSDRSWKFGPRLLNSYPIYAILSFIILAFWMAFIAKNFTERSITALDLPLSLDLSYTPPAGM